MSVTANELNYLIWRYLQEGGLDVSAYALQEETRAQTFEDKLGSKVPLGCLVDLVQKGILYNKVSELIAEDGGAVPEDIVNLDFNLFGALKDETKRDRKLVKGGRVVEESQLEVFAAPSAVKAVATTAAQEQPVEAAKPEADFTRVLRVFYNFPASLCNGWSPTEPLVLGWGQRDENVAVASLQDPAGASIKLLPHPAASKNTVAISWSPKGDSLVTASENGELRLWDSDGAIRFIMALHRAPVLAIKWSPKGARYILTLDAANKTIVWDGTTGQPVQHIDGPDSEAPFGTDACWIDETKFVVPGPRHTLQVYQLGDISEEPVGVLKGHLDTVTAISYNSELRLLCSASDDQTIRLWKGNSTNSLQVLIGHSQPITYLGWLQKGDGSYLVSCSLDSTLRVWDFAKGQSVDLKMVGAGVPVLCAAMSHKDGKVVTGDAEGTIAIWEMSGDEPVYKEAACYQPEEHPQDSLVSELSWSEDDSKVAVSYSDSQSAVVDFATGN